MSTYIQSNSRQVARIMCEITKDLLWNPRKKWALSKNPNTSLSIKVGNSKKTCVTSNRIFDGKLKLTYGELMVVSKCSPENLHNWTTGNEILQRGYYDSNLNLLNALSHTMLHEFAHVIQIILKEDNNERAHGALFYKILDMAHSSSSSVEVRDELNRRCLEIGIDLSTVETNGTGKSSMDFDLDQIVYITGTNSKYNPMKVKMRKRNLTLISINHPTLKLRVHPNNVYLTEIDAQNCQRN